MELRLQYLQQGRFYHFSGHSDLMAINFFSYIQPEFSLTHLPVVFCPVITDPCEETIFTSFVTTFGHQKTVIRSLPMKLISSRQSKPKFFNLSFCIRFCSPLIMLALFQTISSFSVFLLNWEHQNWTLLQPKKC